ncbi:MAG: glycosyltransferase [Paludibaculum sp.]
MSVLVANYNYAQYLEPCLASAMAQTYGNLEIVVCDDGSSDNSLDILMDIARRDSRIRVLSQPNGGQAGALNRAYSECHGAVICILDADDVIASNKVAATVQAFVKEPAAGLATHYVAVIDSDGVRKQRPALPVRLDQGWKGEEMLRQGMDCLLPPATGLSLRREIADRVFPIPPCFRQIADGFVSRAAALLACIAPINQILADYRIHSNNLTGIHVSSVEGLRKQVRLASLLITELCLWVESNLGTHLEPESILRTNSDYLESHLALHILTTPGAVRDRAILLAVVNGPSSRLRKLAWRFLYRLNPGLAGRLLAQWWGPSLSKALLHRLLLRVTRRSQVAAHAK